MRDYYYLGPCPSNENAVQLGWKASDKDWIKARAQMNKYITLLTSMFGPVRDKVAPNVTFTIRKEHGEYAEVAVNFNDQDRAEVEFAIFVEGNLPEDWGDKKVYTEEEYLSMI